VLNLFDSSSGIDDTQLEIKCDCCGRVYNSGLTREKAELMTDDELYGTLVNFVTIGDVCFVECCFNELERFVEFRLNRIIPWYRKKVETWREAIEEKEKLLGIVRGPIKGAGREMEL